MANLVAPVNMLPPTAQRIIEFKGLNKKTVVAEGEMSDMWNLTADNYPVLTPRRPRGKLTLPADVMRPLRILRRFDRIGLIALSTDSTAEDLDVGFWYDGERINEVDDLTVETKAVAINNRMCFFPQKTCIDITKDGVQPGTYRSLDAEASVTNITISTANYTTYFDLPREVGETSCRFRYDDAINITGTLGFTPSGGAAVSVPVNVSCIIENVVADDANHTDRVYLPNNTFIEMASYGATQGSLTGTLSRKMPASLDMVVEWNNRLWGCSNPENTIYACKLGDPFNWNYYQGTSLDSYYAQQGTDEDFTGIAEYSGHLIFFKPNSMTRIYGTSPATYQITNTKAYGVEPGSTASVLTINDTVFYKSSVGIMAYQGGIPYCISDKLQRKFRNVVAGTEGTKYYASVLITNDDGETEGRLIVFDIEKGMWHLEDRLRFTNAIKIEDSIYCTTSTADVLYCDTDVYCNKDLMVSTDLFVGEVQIINPEEPAENFEDLEWMATFGPFDEYIEEHKIYSKLAMRLKANGESSAKVYISLDEGPWEQVETYDHISTKGDFIPIIPRRCDRYSVKIEGKGNAEVKSLTRRVRKGSFGRI